MLVNNTDQTNGICDPAVVLQVACVIPEYVNLAFLTIGLYGMYQGIEIVHPLYAILYLQA